MGNSQQILSAGRSAPVARAGYSMAQIALHWTIAALIVAQLLLHDGIQAAYRFELGGAPPAEVEAILATVHIACGIAVFALALVRIALRLRRGAPPPPQDEHPILKMAALATHVALYAIILLMPLTGALAWFGGIEEMAAVHHFGVLLILGLVGLHTVGAIYHHFVLKTDVLRRMLRRER